MSILEILHLLDEIAAEGHPVQTVLDKFRADLAEKAAEETRLHDEDTDREEARLARLCEAYDMSGVPY